MDARPTSVQTGRRPDLETTEQSARIWHHTPTFYEQHAHHRFADERARLINTLLEAHSELPDGPFGLSLTLPGKLANRMMQCCHVPMIYRNDASDEITLRESSCRGRVCPRCSQAKMAKVQKRITAVVDAMDSPRFLTLTLRSQPVPLDQQVSRLIESFRQLRRRKAWKRHVAGGIFAIEITWSAEGWHPHLHALIDGKFFPHALVKSEWLHVTGDSTIVDIRPVLSRKKAVSYVTKYAAKGTDTRQIPRNRLAEYALAMHGVRMTQTFGKSHGVRVEEEERERSDAVIYIDDFHALHRKACAGSERARALIIQLRRLAAVDRSKLDEWDLDNQKLATREALAEMRKLAGGPPPPWYDARPRPSPAKLLF